MQAHHPRMEVLSRAQRRVKPPVMELAPISAEQLPKVNTQARHRMVVLTRAQRLARVLDSMLRLHPTDKRPLQHPFPGNPTIALTALDFTILTHPLRNTLSAQHIPSLAMSLTQPQSSTTEPLLLLRLLRRLCLALLLLPLHPTRLTTRAT